LILYEEKDLQVMKLTVSVTSEKLLTSIYLKCSTHLKLIIILQSSFPQNF